MPEQPALPSVLDHLLDNLEQNTDPTDRAKAAGHLLESILRAQTRAKDMRRAAVVAMHDGGLSYSKIAAELGVSKGRAAQIAAGD
jgi:DNA-directed RNA polymerase specialized sigma24 family protein